MNKRWTAAALLVLGLTVPMSAQAQSIVGEVTYQERIALPPTALLEVSLEDVSRAGSAGDVVSRLTQRTPSGSPIAFTLPFEGARIDARNRYAVRAEIRDGRRVLFTSVEPVLAVTQGRGVKVAIPLRLVNAPLKPVAEAAPVKASPAPAEVTLAAPRPLPAAIELRNLPATFTGTLAGVGYELNLFANDSFFLRTTPAGAAGTDDVGSWVLSSDRREIVLRSAKGSVERFAVRDNTRLRRIDGAGAGETAAAQNDLRRLPAFRPLDVRGTFTGAYAVDAASARFIECSTGQAWTMAVGESSEALAAAHKAAGTRLGAPVIMTVQGRLETRRAGTAPETVFVAESLGRVERNSACPARFAALPLENTRWVLNTVATAGPAAGAPSLVFRGESNTFAGRGGCHRTTGRYRTGGETLALQATGTMRACKPGETADDRLSQVLGGTRRYLIAGNVLELYGGENQVLARFEGQ